MCTDSANLFNLVSKIGIFILFDKKIGKLHAKINNPHISPVKVYCSFAVKIHIWLNWMIDIWLNLDSFEGLKNLQKTVLFCLFSLEWHWNAKKVASKTLKLQMWPNLTSKCSLSKQYPQSNICFSKNLLNIQRKHDFFCDIPFLFTISLPICGTLLFF